MWRSASRLPGSTRCPSTLTCPRASGRYPAAAERSVVLPAPLGPIKPSRSPARSDIDTSRTATSLPNWTRTPSIDRIVSRPLSLGGIVWARCVRYGRRGRGIPPLLHLRIVRRRQEDRLVLLDDLPGLLRFIA